MKTISSLKDSCRGQEIYLVGKGPSLIGFDWKRLKGKKVIALNSAIKFLPWADWFFMDVEYILKRQELWQCFRGKRIFAFKSPLPVTHETAEVIRYSICYGSRITRHQEALFFASTSMSMAIHLAWIMGASGINLLGFDLGHVPGIESHSIDSSDPPMSITHAWRINHSIKPLLKRILAATTGKPVQFKWPVRVFLHFDKWGDSIVNPALANLMDKHLIPANIDEL